LWSTFPTVEITPRFHLPKDDAADQAESRRLSFLEWLLHAQLSAA
jgi:hypothetical protein